MGLVAAKCTQCGANIEVDDTKEAGICKFCGTAFITEKAIYNYNTYITNNIVNNNDFHDANITIQNNENIGGLLLLAKRKMQSKAYFSEELCQYLDDIIIKSPVGMERVLELFREMGFYEMADAVVYQKSGIDTSYQCPISRLLVKYDPDNIIGWLMYWNVPYNSRTVDVGENIIRLAKDSEKAMYEKEIYSYYVEHGSQCYNYKEYLKAIPSTYIKSNKYIQDLLIEQVNKKDRAEGFSEEENKDRIEYIESLLPSDRLNDIKIVPQKNDTSGGCYIATCVYGTYDCPQVWTLRRFRDHMLDKTWYGKTFIKCYYFISPTLVKWFGETKWFKRFWKSKLDKMIVNLNNKGVDNTYYCDKY